MAHLARRLARCLALHLALPLALSLCVVLQAAAQPHDGRAAVQLIAGDLGGQSLWLDAAVENLQALAFNDSASHIEIRQGRWELCSDGGFGGVCQVFGPGRHELPPTLRNRLSSLRPTSATVGSPRPPPPGAGGGDIVLYEHPDFSGRWLALSEPERNLATRDFNDTVSAVEIRRGRWELCRHADFGGDCIVLGPGRHTLQRRVQDEISSLRPLGGRGWNGGGWGDDRGRDEGHGHHRDRDRDRGWDGGGGGSGGPHDGPRRSVLLFEAEAGQGRSVRIDDAVPNLRDLDFNDRATSIEVQDGRWELCADAGFGAPCQTYGPGRYRLPPALAGRVSSLRPR